MPVPSQRKSKIVDCCQRIVSNPFFEPAVLLVILVNAIVLGLETFKGISSGHLELFDEIYVVILAAYIIEILIRFAATGWNLRAFFADKWNIFDVVVIAAVLVPGIGRTGTVLRLVRLFRIARVVRFLPDLQVVMVAIAKSVRGMASLAAATALLLYIYAMLGWIFFADHDPAHYGNIGHAMLTMFVMLTLENLPDNVKMGQEVSQWSILFFISYVLIMSFLIFNLFIGIVVGAMEQARAIDNAEHETDDLLSRLRSVRRTIEEAERELERTHRDDR